MFAVLMVVIGLGGAAAASPAISEPSSGAAVKLQTIGPFDSIGPVSPTRIPYMTQVVVTVGRDGRPKSCDVLKPSLSVEADKAACLRAQSASYLPAKKPNRRPSSGKWLGWVASERTASPDAEKSGSRATQPALLTSPIQAYYPTKAMREGRGGRVSFTAQISPEGRAIACATTGSSGSEDLDDAACKQVLMYARFEPAHDKNGSVVESSFESRIVYRLD